MKMKRYLPAIFAAVFMLSTAAYADKVRVGVVGAANDKVMAVDAADKKERTLKTGDEIFFEETIRTDGAGNAQLMFIDKSSLTVGANAEIKIDKFVYDPATEKGEMGLTSTKGAFRFIGGALSKEKPAKIKTPVGTIGIRGSIAMFAVDGTSGATTSTFVSGSEMTMTNLNGITQVTNTFGTASTIATPTSPPTPPVRIDASVLSNTFVAPLTPPAGTSGGATVVPQAEQVNTQLSGKLDNAPALSPAGTPAPDGNASPQDAGGNGSGNNGTGSTGGTDGGNAGSGTTGGNSGGASGGTDGSQPQGGQAPQGDGTGAPANNPQGGTAPAGQNPPPPPAGAPQPQNGSGLILPPTTTTASGIGSAGPIVFPVSFQPIQPVGPVGGPPVPLPPNTIASAGQTFTTTTTSDGTTTACTGTSCPPPPTGSLPPPPDGSLPPPPTGSTTTCTGTSCPPPPTTTTTCTATDGSCTPPPTTTTTCIGTNCPPPPPPPDGSTTTTTTTTGGTAGGTTSGGGGTTAPPPLNPTTFGLFTGTSSSSLEEAGIIEGEISGGILKTNLYRNYPMNAPGEREDLAMGPNPGLNSLSFTSGGTNDSFSGYQYRTADNAFMFYQLYDSIGEQYNAVLGTFIDASALPTTGYSTYSFLPELYQYLGASSPTFGYFSYNIINTSLIPSGLVSGTSTSTPGLIVSWDRKMYLTGYYSSSYSSSSLYSSGFKIAFGKVSASGTPILSEGRIIEFKNFNDGTTVELNKLGNGYIKSEAAYGNAANGAEGFILKGILPDSSFGGGDAFAAGVNGYKIVQPAVTSETAPTGVAAAIGAGATSGSWNGYTAGFDVHDVSGTKTLDRYASSAPSDVSITRINSGSNSAIHSTVNVQNDAASSSINASFGSSTNTAGSPQHAFISDKMYAMEQASQTTGGVNTSTRNGAMVSSFIAGGNRCSGCNYVDWGVWATEAKPAANITDTTMMPYIAGEVTNNISGIGGLPSTATFSGKAIGNIADISGAKITPHEGDFSANVNFGTKKVTNFQISNFGGYNLNYSGNAPINPTGAATFTVTPTGSGISNAVANGAFFGPNAENMGGNFKFDDTTNNKAGAGVFLGTR